MIEDVLCLTHGTWEERHVHKIISFSIGIEHGEKIEAANGCLKFGAEKGYFWNNNTAISI